MSFLRKLLPVKLAGRFALLAVLVFLCLLLMTAWNLSQSSDISHIPSRNSRIVKVSSNSKLSNVRRSGSSNLILPGPVIVEAKEEAAVPKMFKAFQQDPQGFADNWRMPTRFPQKSADKPGAVTKLRGKRKKGDEPELEDGTPRVNCNINNQTTVTCMRASKTGEIYMPFKFIEKYFQVYGEFVNSSTKHKKGTFYFHHGNAHLWPIAERYDHRREFLFFGQYDVEGRSRVMLVSGIHGVPVSSQWNKDGHIYPIQVSQYGLSHYSKSLTDTGIESDRFTVLENGTQTPSKWKVPEDATIKQTTDSGEPVIYFNSLKSTGAPSLLVKEKHVDSCLSFDVKFLSDSANVTVVIAAKDGTYAITYHSEQTMKSVRADSMVYGIGSCKTWCSLHRDIMVDFKKFAKVGSDWWTKRKAALVSIQQIEVAGEGYIDNIQLSHKCHIGHFKDASNWLLKAQDSHGGWPVTVQRVITTEKLTLPPGWYSAMGQGQAISLLVRAYITYNNTEYLNAAVRGLSVYNMLSADHGVKAVFMDKYNWYEEYPTDPPLFVLNGFIYSLFGLYDLSQVAHGEAKVTVQKLLSDGMTSLKAMLPFFDSGTGTFYDLRHYAIPGMAPNRARWDYHTVHIAQLLNLATIDSDPVFSATANRWVGYLNGVWAPHN